MYSSLIEISSIVPSLAKALISAIKTPSESLNVAASPEPLATSAERVTVLPLVGI